MGTACYSKKQKKQDNQQNITPQSFSDSFKTISPIQPTKSGGQQNHQIIWKKEMLMSIQNEQIEDPDLIPPRLYFNSSQKKEEKETFGGKKKNQSFRLNNRVQKKFEETQLFGKTIHTKYLLKSKPSIYQKLPLYSKSFTNH